MQPIMTVIITQQGLQADFLTNLARALYATARCFVPQHDMSPYSNYKHLQLVNKYKIHCPFQFQKYTLTLHDVFQLLFHD
jgi:hypothetical protein